MNVLYSLRIRSRLRTNFPEGGKGRKGQAYSQTITEFHKLQCFTRENSLLLQRKEDCQIQNKIQTAQANLNFRYKTNSKKFYHKHITRQHGTYLKFKSNRALSLPGSPIRGLFVTTQPKHIYLRICLSFRLVWGHHYSVLVVGFCDCFGLSCYQGLKPGLPGSLQSPWSQTETNDYV